MYAIISQIYENILGAGTIQPGCLAPEFPLLKI